MKVVLLHMQGQTCAGMICSRKKNPLGKMLTGRDAHSTWWKSNMKAPVIIYPTAWETSIAFNIPSNMEPFSAIFPPETNKTTELMLWHLIGKDQVELVSCDPSWLVMRRTPGPVAMMRWVLFPPPAAFLAAHLLAGWLLGPAASVIITWARWAGRHVGR